jgi:hypothetical protein
MRLANEIADRRPGLAKVQHAICRTALSHFVVEPDKRDVVIRDDPPVFIDEPLRHNE